MNTRTRFTKRLIATVVAAVMVAPLTTATAAPISIDAAHLAVGGEAFRGPYPIDLAQVPSADQCGVSGECPEWQVTVDSGGARLRVALSAVFQEDGDSRAWADFPGRASEMLFRVQLLDQQRRVLAKCSSPSGTPTSCSGGTDGAYAVEVFLPAPAAGTYTVRVIPESVHDMAFRLRAKLEAPTEPVRGKPGPAVLTPNLRAIPPFEFNFYSPTATYGPGAPVPAPGASCMAEEIEEAVEVGRPAPRVCLRYSMGFENAGDGMFWLSVFCPACQHYYQHVKPVGQAACDVFWGIWDPSRRCQMGDTTGEPGTSQDWPLTQVRFYADGTCCKVEPLGSAGVGRFHPTHAHLHYQNAYFFELLRVSDEEWTPEDGRPKHLDKVGPGGKLGIFPGDELMADWDRFYQHRRGACPRHTPDHCGMGMGNHPLTGIGEPRVNAGWGDVYEWNRGGNYVDFPADLLGRPFEGYYVLRGNSDPDGLIIETNEKDNKSYGFIHVLSDGTVELLERGYGTDPWDKGKILSSVAPG